MSKGKLAFLFLMITDSKATSIWRRFFQNVDPTQYTRYCHTKRPPQDSFWQQCHIRRRIPTRWGDISLVQATLLLLQEALTDCHNEYFVLLSDSCIPIVDFQLLAQQLRHRGQSWIHYKHIENRTTRYQQLGLGIKQKLPWSRFYSQHQWTILRRSHALQILQMTPTYLPYFRKVHAVDEHYLVTLLWLAGVLETECYNHKITYCDWSDRTKSHPATFKVVTDQLVELAQSHGNFFLRKVTDNCRIGPYLNYILDSARTGKD